ncbi:uncharacterized protein [Mytilus edulis]|uniref:uncharacterized protein n=1 Tax=Mytilus edulis TaxID=6550 RepID=UPI0039F10D9E
MSYQDIRKYFESHVKIIILVLFLINVLTLIIVLGILWDMSEPSTPVENCGYLCLEMEKNSDYMKCGCRAEVLQEYTEKTFDEKLMTISKEYRDMFKSSSVKMHNGYIGDVKPVAHLIGEDTDMPTKDDTRKEILPVKKWYRGNNCLLLNGIKLHRGRVRVPVSGFYHVYSAIEFNYHLIRDTERNTIEVHSKSPNMKHVIYKSNIKNSKKEDEIMCTQHPYERSENLVFSRYDTYISGDTYLEAGDEIYVKVANISYASSPPKNIFGIILI